MTTARKSAAIPDYAQLAIQASQAVAAIKEWQAYLDAIKQQLTEMHEAGTVPTKFDVGNFKFALQPGRVTVSLDDEYKARVTLLQEEALANGHAVRKQGADFWVIKEGK